MDSLPSVIYSKLSEIAELNGNVHWLSAPDAMEIPYACFQFQSKVKANEFGGCFNARIQFDLYHGNKEQIWDIGGLIKQKIETIRGLFGALEIFNNSFIQMVSEAVDLNLYHIRIESYFYYKEG